MTLADTKNMLLFFSKLMGELRAAALSGVGNSYIAMLAAAGTGALLFTLTAGFFVYSNTQSLVAAKDWVEHTQEVLNSLQNASLLVDRIEFSERLYALNKDESQLNIAYLSAIGLETVALRLHMLVSDNSGQSQNSQTLTTCAGSVRQDVSEHEQLVSLPIYKLLSCREAISLMAEQERGLLKQRTAKSQRSSLFSLTTECIFVGFSLLTLVVLFGFLLRDAVLRRSTARYIGRMNENLAGSVQALEERITDARLLTLCRDELQLCVDVRQVYRAAAVCLDRLLPGSSGSLCILNHSHNLLEAVSDWGTFTSLQADTFAPETCCGLRLGQLRWRHTGISEIDCTHFSAESPERYLCVPLVAQGETLGVLSIECDRPEAYAMLQRRIDGMLQLLQLTGMAVASLNLRTRLENQSVRDPLTGLFNRYFMQIVLARELARADRQASSVAMLMLDVDYFKRFNDAYGHGAGDAMLRSIGDVFRAGVRTEDTICRYGGEEFAIILPGATAQVAAICAERIRLAVAELQLPIDTAPGAKASVSIGIALYPADAADGEALLRKADQALYRAKHNGRNQVCAASVHTVNIHSESLLDTSTALRLMELPKGATLAEA